MFKWIERDKRIRRLADEAVIPVDQANRDYQEVLTWVGAGNVIQDEDPRLTVDQRADMAIDSTDRLIFEVLFDIENRVRVLEAKAAVTRAQYRTALITRWKALNS